MRVVTRRLLLMLGVFAVTFGSMGIPVAAQEPEPGPEAAQFLVPADVLGEGWSQIQRAGLDLPADMFREGAVGVYVGPSGARILAVSLLVTDSRVAVRRAWEYADDLYGRYYSDLEYDWRRPDQLDALPIPEGCAEAKRIDGTVLQLRFDMGLPMGITLCAVDPDVILLVAASGTIEDMTGSAAADLVVERMIQAGTGELDLGTPTP